MSFHQAVGALTILLAGTQTCAQPLADHHQHLFSPKATSMNPSVAPLAAADLVRYLKDAGIRRAVVLSLAYQFANPNRPAVADEYNVIKAENDWTGRQAAQFPRMLRAFCSVNPLKDYALEEIDRCSKQRQLRTGLKMHFGNSDVDLERDEHVEQLRRVFKAANQRRMAIVVHMRSSISRKRPYGARSARIFLEKLMPEAPDIHVQIAHMAGAGGFDDPLVDEAVGVFVEAIAKRDTRLARVFFDISGVAGLGEWRGKKDRIAQRMRELGVKRLLYGSDAATPGTTPRDMWKAFRELPLAEDEFRTIEKNVAPYSR